MSSVFKHQAGNEDVTFRERLAHALKVCAARGVFFGGSSWKYPGWLGQIYTRERYESRGKFSRKKFDAECLSEYAEVFPAVGVDFSFYTFPSQEQWAHVFSASPKLHFGLKAPETITVKKWPSHARYGARGGTENDEFLNAGLLRDAFLEPLLPYRGQVGVVMFEFGTFAKSSYAEPARFVDDLDHFLSALPVEFRYGVEIRNREYLRDDYFACLKANRVAHVFNAWSRMPTLYSQMEHQAAFTTDFIVSRALLRTGRQYEQAVKSFEPYEHVQDPNPEARDALAALGRRAELEKKIAYIFVNNRLEGNAPETMMAVAELLLDAEQ